MKAVISKLSGIFSPVSNSGGSLSSHPISRSSKPISKDKLANFYFNFYLILKPLQTF